MRIPFNYCLIRPDENFRSYTFNGKNTFHTSYDAISSGQRLSVRGTIVQLPEELIYNGENIIEERSRFANDRSSLNVYRDLKDTSLLFKTIIEPKVGDVVFFNYMEHYDCYQNGRFIEKEDYDLLLMRYDSLICSHRLNNLNSLKPLNGLVLIEPISIEKPKSIIETVDLKKDKNKIHKTAFAQIILTGLKCNGYIEDLDAPKDNNEFKKGQIVMFKPSAARPIEWGLHQVLFKDRRILAIHRKDIIMKKK